MPRVMPAMPGALTPVTCSGVAWLLNVPSPSSPDELAPQAQTVPLERSALGAVGADADTSLPVPTSALPGQAGLCSTGVLKKSARCDRAVRELAGRAPKRPPPSPPRLSFSRTWSPNIDATAAEMNIPYAAA